MINILLTIGNMLVYMKYLREQHLSIYHVLIHKLEQILEVLNTLYWPFTCKFDMSYQTETLDHVKFICKNIPKLHTLLHEIYQIWLC